MTVIDVLQPVHPPLLSTPPETPMEGSTNLSPNEDTAAQRLLEPGNGPGTKNSMVKKQKTAVKPQARGRRKSRWKLKFHHQALPPEYLKHYKQQEKKRRLTEKVKVKKTVKKSGEGCSSEFPSMDSLLRTNAQEEAASVEGDEFNFLETDVAQTGADSEEQKKESRVLEQKLREGLWPPTSGVLGDNFPHLNIDLSQNKAFLENLLSNQIAINRVDRPEQESIPVKPVKPQKVKAIPSSGKIMNYSDLPYMGEITLEGIKPRRGRKPKKADICHLIYKNYGQVFPGAPNSEPEKPPRETKWKIPPRVPSTQNFRPQVESPLPTVSGLINHTEVQNRIINSLLEKRLTQEARGKPETFSKPEGNLEEPLNLCLRDLQSLKIKLSRKHGNIYETKSPKPQAAKEQIEVKKEVIELDSDDDTSIDDVDLTPFNLVTTELRESSDDESSVSLGNQVTLTKVSDRSPAGGILADNSMYWPGGNYFCPNAPLFPELYYHKNAGKSPPSEKKQLRAIKPKQSSKRLPSKIDTSAAQVIAKRKRSAIFIPPVPAENTSNPTTEVSICKFKFTGGAKPSLQEKKMLSVDAGGNFRYYSGTGDKSMRGYEYFPRESLQQCQENTGCSPSGVFLTASALGSGERIPEEVGQSNFFDTGFPLQMPGKKNSGKNLESGGTLREHMTDSFDEEDSEGSLGTAPSPGLEYLRDENSTGDDPNSRRPRRSRKSLAREKLEQTFKEKGFLIQTQQLESAEGATYCKFRQLRKFTRYLFRSWKDYLPGNVRDLSKDAGVAPPQEELAQPLKIETQES